MYAVAIQREKGYLPLPNLISAHPSVSDGHFCSASISTAHQWTFQEMVLPGIITEVPEILAA